jgi:hypothetical protein
MNDLDTLPPDVARLFWDYKGDSVRWPRDRETIARRVLESGPWAAVKWLRRQMGDADLRAWIVAHDGRNLTPQQLRFWQLILKLPKRQVDAWVARERGGAWNRRVEKRVGESN